MLFNTSASLLIQESEVLVSKREGAVNAMTNTLSSCHLVPSTPCSSSSHALLRRRLPLAPHITTNRHGSQTLRCAAAQRSSPSAVRRSARKGKNKREDVKLVEEEVYNIDEGWKIELDSTEKVRKSLLLLLPV
jgi:hypothetical protein